jgi:hypothetical protein
MTVQGNVESLGDVGRDPKVAGQEVGGTGRDDSDSDFRSRQGVDRPLDRPVAAPQQEVGPRRP